MCVRVEMIGFEMTCAKFVFSPNNKVVQYPSVPTIVCTIEVMLFYSSFLAAVALGAYGPQPQLMRPGEGPHHHGLVPRPPHQPGFPGHAATAALLSGAAGRPYDDTLAQVKVTMHSTFSTASF